MVPSRSLRVEPIMFVAKGYMAMRGPFLMIACLGMASVAVADMLPMEESDLDEVSGQASIFSVDYTAPGQNGNPNDGCNDACEFTDIGECGAVSGSTRYDFDNSGDSLFATSANLCNSGTVDNFLFDTGTHSWSWICTGVNGGSDMSCGADENRCGDSAAQTGDGEQCDDGQNGNPDDGCNDACEFTDIGACGAVSGSTIYDFDNSGDSLFATSANLCTSGSVDTFLYATGTHSWSWSCT